MVEIFNAENRSSTLYLTAMYALFTMSVYFFLSWTPKLVADLGFSAATSATVAVTRDLSGIIGGALVGWAAHYLGLKRLAVVVLAGMGLAIVLFGRLPADITQLRLAAALAGLFLYGGAVVSYAILARNFATHVRATGTGFVIGVGRIASAIAPLLGGYLFAIGWDRSEVTAAMAMGAIGAAILLIAYKVRPIGVDQA
jgi:MFS family permease